MTKQHKPNSFVYVTVGGSVELADNEGGKFKRFRKMIAKYGDYVDPRGGKEPMKINHQLAEKFVENFKAGVRGFIPTPLGHPKTDAELAEKNKGELVDMEAGEDGLYGILEIRNVQTAEDIENKILPDVSIAFDDDYQDKTSGKWVGPTIKHVGLVVNPYLKGMTQFEPALSEASSAAVLFSDNSEATNNNNEKEKVTMAKQKNTRDFEVTLKYTENGEEKEVKVAPGAEVEVPEDVAEAVAKQITDAEKPAAAEGEKSQQEKDLEAREAAAEKKEAELAEKEADAAYQRLLGEGKIVPAQKDAFIALSSKGSASVELSDGESKTVSALLSELFGKAPEGKYLSEEGAGDSNGGGDKKVELSDEEKSLGADFGNTPEEIEEFKKSQESK